MEPRVRYVKTKDGVGIAFATHGQGDAIVWAMNPMASHVQLEWEQPLIRAGIGRLVAEHRTVVRFDPRGFGLSDRDVDDLSLDSQVRDLEAVTNQLGLKTFGLVALEYGGLPAISYAFRHPERVTHLVLMNCFARGADWTATPRGKAFMGIAAEDWEMWSENVGAMIFGFGREEARRYGEFIRACTDPKTVLRFRTASEAIDVSQLLPQITAPALVVRHNGLKYLSMDTARELASRIPNARLLVIEGSYPDNVDKLFAGVYDFLGYQRPARPEARLSEFGALRTDTTPRSGLTVILFADVVDSTGLTERLGDGAFRDKARDLDRNLREVVRGANGTPIEGKLLGDGVLAVFTSARQAIEAAVKCGREGDSAGLQLHLGLHAGDVIREEGNVFGGAVNIAARVAGEASAGEVLVSQTVRDLARTSTGVSFEDRGERTLKGVSEPVRLWRVVDR